MAAPQSTSDGGSSGYGWRRGSGWFFAPAALLVALVLPPPEGLDVAAWHTAGVAALMAVLWITESIPIPATALLPLVIFPLHGPSSVKEAAAPYADPVIFLFLGGFIIALAMQRWGLHRRIAIHLIGALGTRPDRVVGGFLLASALISMWVSNTATALMMLPIAVSVLSLLPVGRAGNPSTDGFKTALVLAVAYGATAGGMATLIGTPPNAMLAGFVSRTYGFPLGFGQWMLLGVPVTLLTLPCIWLVLTRIAFRLDRHDLPGLRALLDAEKTHLGRMSRGERSVALVFGLTSLLWIARPALSAAIPQLSDTGIAMIGALALFVVPTNLQRGEFVMTWEATKGLPWDVMLLFGGGLSLADHIQSSGLAAYLGTQAATLQGMPFVLVVAIFAFAILMLTELTSNTATAATFLPVAAAVAANLGENPLFLLIPTALAANCAFMLPVGTPPNAIAFGSGAVTLPQMARAGLLLNLALIPIILSLVFLLGPWLFGHPLALDPPK